MQPEPGLDPSWGRVSLPVGFGPPSATGTRALTGGWCCALVLLCSYGYDPLGLGKDPEQVAKYRANELLHARWAMLAAAGILIPEGLQANGADIKGGTWFETGAEMLNGGTLNYFAVPWTVINNPLPLFIVIAIEVVLMGAVEKFRSDGTGPAGYSPGTRGLLLLPTDLARPACVHITRVQGSLAAQLSAFALFAHPLCVFEHTLAGIGKFDSSVFDNLDSLYPGGPFDPLGLADDPEVFQELKVKEIKNGRLAMVSVLVSNSAWGLTSI